MLIKNKVLCTKLCVVESGIQIHISNKGQNEEILCQVKQCVCQSGDNMVLNSVTSFRRISESYLDNEWFLLYQCHPQIRAADVVTH